MISLIPVFTNSLSSFKSFHDPHKAHRLKADVLLNAFEFSEFGYVVFSKK